MNLPVERPAVSPGDELRRRRAYRQANRLIVSAGILLASRGVPPEAPEMTALRYALRMVNRAGGIEAPRFRPLQPQSREVLRESEV